MIVLAFCGIIIILAHETTGRRIHSKRCKRIELATLEAPGATWTEQRECLPFHNQFGYSTPGDSRHHTKPIRFDAGPYRKREMPRERRMDAAAWIKGVSE
jgi:hypothetical protein